MQNIANSFLLKEDYTYGIFQGYPVERPILILGWQPSTRAQSASCCLAKWATEKGNYSDRIFSALEKKWEGLTFTNIKGSGKPGEQDIQKMRLVDRARGCAGQ